MKILILANDGEGLYKFRKELLVELIKNNDVFVSLPEDIYTKPLQDLGCNFINTFFNRKGINPFKDIKLIFFYIKLLKEIKPNVVLTYTIKPNVYGGLACRIKKIPYIANITGLGSALENGGLLQKIAIILYRIGLKKAYKVFFQNADNREFMFKHKIVKNNTEIIPGSGVNLKYYELLDYPKTGTIDFAYIGRIMKQKGFEQYIDCAKYIREKYKNTRFHICGIFEDDYKDIVNDLVNKGIVIYHGSVMDVKNEIYKNIECVIHPTYYAEGMSNVLLEASACGRSIITTNRPGCKEIIDDGINGFIVSQKDSKDLINKVEKYINLSKQERIQMGLNGRKKVEKDFDRNIVINKYIETINELKHE